MSRLELYDRQDCPYSKRVRKTLADLDIEYDETVVADAHGDRTTLERRTGQTGVPVLFDERLPDGWLADSSEIIDYLRRTYG